MSDRSAVVFLIDGTFEGLLSALFFGFSNRIVPADVTECTYQTDLFHQPLQIPTDRERAKRVARGIRRAAGDFCYQQLYLAFLCDEEDRFLPIYQYACLLLTQGAKARYAIATEAGAKVAGLAQFAKREAHMMMEILRFTVLEDGVLYAPIAPKCDCMELVLEHFAKRFSGERMIICDTNHRKAGIFQPPDHQAILPVTSIPQPQLGEEEKAYRALWKQFFLSVAIQQRKNLKAQNTHLPKRHRKYMNEFF